MQVDAESSSQTLLFRNSPVPVTVKPEAPLIPKPETGSWASVMSERAHLLKRNECMEWKRQRVSSIQQDGQWRGLVNLDEVPVSDSSCSTVENGTGQKLLTNRKHGSRRLIGALRKLDPREYLSEFNGDSNRDICSEAATDNDAEISYIKDLLEEEMIGKQNQKNTNKAEEEKRSVFTGEVYSKKSQNRMNKKSFDLGVADEAASETIAYQKHKTSKSLDLGVIMEELRGLLPPMNGYHSQGPGSEVVLQSRQDSSVKEHQLGEFTKLLVDSFSNENKKDVDTQAPKELLDALHLINSDKEIFLKLPLEPGSQLLLHLQMLQDPHSRKDENSQQLLDQVLNNGKQDSFFLRKFKALERSLSKKNTCSEDLNSVVIVNSNPPSANVETTLTSNDGQFETGSSSFSFGELKRRLKLAVSKELRGSKDVSKASRAENDGLPSPGSPRKDHLSLEKVPETLCNVNKEDYMGKPVESGALMGQRVSNIYAEARKHLAEVVGSSDADLDFQSSQVQKSLGRVLSFPDFRSPVYSPRQGGDHSITCISRTPSPCNESECSKGNASVRTVGLKESVNECTEAQGWVNEWTEDRSSVNQGTDCNHGTEGESCITNDELQDEASAELNPDNEFSLSGRKLESAVLIKVVRSSNAEFDHVNSVYPSCPAMASGDAEAIDALDSIEEKGPSASFELDALEVSSSFVSQSGSSPIKEVDGLNGSTDRVNQASPVSVLDQIYKEYDSSSPCTKSLMVSSIEPMQPRQIHFEEQALSPIPRRFAYITSYEEGEKSMFEFLEVVLENSCLTWDELVQQPLCSSRFLDPSLFDEVELLQDDLCDDPKLIFDLIEECFLEICLHHLGSPVFKGKDIFAETWERVERYFKLEEMPGNLERIIASDYVKNPQWTNLRPDTESVGTEMEETILEELIETIILDCMLSL
ncbi:hypothetical protein AKJ16_DCAP02597 [Drosera capensis]